MQVNRWHTVVLCSTILATAFAAPAAVPASGPVSSSHSNGAGAPGRDIVTWNQSQHGKYNLQVSLKDIKIIAVLNSDFYDEDEDLEVRRCNVTNYNIFLHGIAI